MVYPIPHSATRTTLKEHVPPVEVARFSRSGIVIYNWYPNKLARTEKQKANEKNLTRGDYNGYMSPKTRSKVKKYLGTWFDVVSVLQSKKIRSKLSKKPYLTFVTLTLPSSQAHSDNEIKRKVLMPFIQQMKRKCGIREYFWRAESQENGNIHFHLIVDSYIPWRDLRVIWNKCVNVLNYVDEFEAKNGHRDPNSTDIHKIVDLSDLEAYVIKYTCKSDGYRPIKGRIHGCSDGLKTLSPYETLIDSDTRDIIEDAINSKDAKLIHHESTTLVICKPFTLKEWKYSAKSRERDKYLNELGLYLYGKDENAFVLPESVVPEKDNIIIDQSVVQLEFDLVCETSETVQLEAAIRR